MRYLFDAFISHSSKDNAATDTLYEVLSEKGFKVWYDRKDVRAGARLLKTIGAGLEQSRYVLLCHTRHSKRSKWAAEEREIIIADEIGTGTTRTVVLLFDKTPLRPELRHKRYIDLCAPSSPGWAELFDFLNQDADKLIRYFRRSLLAGRQVAVAAGRLKDIAVRKSDSDALGALWHCADARRTNYQIVDAAAWAIGQIAIACKAKALQDELAGIFRDAVASKTELVIDKFAYTAGQIALNAVDRKRRVWAQQMIDDCCRHKDRTVREKFRFTAERIGSLQGRTVGPAPPPGRKRPSPSRRRA